MLFFQILFFKSLVVVYLWKLNSVQRSSRIPPMDSVFSATTSKIAICCVSKALNRRLFEIVRRRCVHGVDRARRFSCISSYLDLYGTTGLSGSSSPSLRTLQVVLPSLRRPLRCVSSSSVSFASGGGNGGLGGKNGGGGRGGDGELGGGDGNKFVSGSAEEVSSLLPNVIILDVGVRILHHFFGSWFILSLHLSFVFYLYRILRYLDALFFPDPSPVPYYCNLFFFS